MNSLSPARKAYLLSVRRQKRQVRLWQIALLAGSPRASRIVGGALHRNPSPGVIPCHRVVFRDGSLAPGFAFGGAGAQRALLEAEGVPFLPDGRVDLPRCRWENEKETL